MPQLLSSVRTPTNDQDTALVKPAKTAPTVRHGEAPQAAQPTPGENVVRRCTPACREWERQLYLPTRSMSAGPTCRWGLQKQPTVLGKVRCALGMSQVDAVNRLCQELWRHYWDPHGRPAPLKWQVCQTTERRRVVVRLAKRGQNSERGLM